MRAPSTLRARAVLVALTLFAPATGPATCLAQDPDPGPLFEARDAWIAAAYLGAAAIAFPFDRAIAEEIRDSVIQTTALRRTSRAFDLLGVPGAAILTGGLYAAGRLTDNGSMADVGLHALEAFVMAEVVTVVLKYTAGRSRPRRDATDPFDFKLFRGLLQGSDFQAFPSGHTSGAFAVAAAFAHEMERLWGGSPWLYGLVYVPASFVGVSRMFDNHHWTSDVVFGAAIGAFSGWKTVQYGHDHPDSRLNRWFLAGSYTPGATVPLRLGVMPLP
ncbi:MAG: phosphatase PAP2 family protein [Gemmatimonadetes bacterium]|nr:phosphatase PAP2 family protein [Gemmatimonadota bacterium]